MQDELQGALQNLHAQASQLLNMHLHNWMEQLANGGNVASAQHLPAVAQALHIVQGALAPFLPHPGQGDGDA